MLPFPTQPGQVGGHEGVGKIVKLGAGTESSNLKIGDRVGVKWVSSACGHCRMFPTYTPSRQKQIATDIHLKKNPAKQAPTDSASTEKYLATTPQEHSNNTPWDQQTT
jgi:NADPH:quinone reductase-like Zn-dependent oxidoreductase